MKSIVAVVACAVRLPSAAFAKGAAEGTPAAKDVLLTLPWQQNVYTNRFTTMCETAGVVDGLELQYGKGYAQRQAMTHVEGKKKGTCIYKAQVIVKKGGKGEKGERGGKGEREIPYRLAINGKALARGKEKAEGVVKLWKDEDKDFTSAVWGDNQGGAHGGDWGADIYAHVTAVFEHMRSRKIDFGITSGDVATQCNYDKKGGFAPAARMRLRTTSRARPHARRVPAALRRHRVAGAGGGDGARGEAAFARLADGRV